MFFFLEIALAYGWYLLDFMSLGYSGYIYKEIIIFMPSTSVILL